MKMNRNFNAFTDLKPPELEVPIICLATGCVSGRRDRRLGPTGAGKDSKNESQDGLEMTSDTPSVR
jgi:hypothetical protein